MIAIFKREFRSYFTTPIGYAAMAILLGFCGWFFSENTIKGHSASLTAVYGNLFSVVVLVVLPILTMRSFSEEKRQRTDQALFTAPVSLAGIVLGKFLAAMALFALSLSVTFVYGIVINTQVTPDWLVIITNYVGMLLMAGLIVAAGLLFSSLTESQIVAALITSAFSFLIVMINTLVQWTREVKWLSEAIAFLSLQTRYVGFTQGIIQYDNIFFFLSMQALLLFLTVRVLDSKRWN